MSLSALLTTTLIFLFIGASSYVFGRRVFGCDDTRLENHGAYLALGVTVFGYGVLILGLFKIFDLAALVALLILMFVVGIYGFKIPRINIRMDWISCGITLVSVLMLSSVYLASMQPPHTSDELNYHFPQSQDIVNSRQIDLRFGGHYFYGAIPKHMEILFAAGIAIDGYSLAHSLHFMYFVAFLVVVYGILYQTHGARAASLGVFMLLMYQDLTWNVSSGFVDGAAFCLEIMALMYAIRFLSTKKRDMRDIRLAGLLVGSGLAIKYSVGITAAYMTLILLPNLRVVFELIKYAILMGGFWYGKNLFLFGNPTYPLYFGHHGVSREEYLSLMAAIQQFGVKSWETFARLMNYFTEITRLPVYIALIMAPLSLLVTRSSTFVRLLLLYVSLYIPYWFFLGTHQLRFFAPAVMGALILAGIMFSRVRGRWLIIGAVILTIVMFKTPYYDQSIGSYFWNTRLHLTERQYGLGNLSRDEFMKRWYGCYFETISYLNEIQDGKKVIDNWSYGIEFNVPFYSRGHEYIVWTDLDVERMQQQNIGYLYVRESNKDAYGHRTEPSFAQAIPVYNLLDNYFIERATMVKQIDDCLLYRLDEGDLGSDAK